MEINKYFKILQNIAEKNGGKILSSGWKGSNFKYLFSLTNGIKFERSYEIIKKNGWPKNQ